MARPLRKNYPGAFKKPDKNLPALKELTEKATMKDIFDEVETTLGENPALARNVKMYLCQRYTGEKLKHIGTRFGIGESGVSQASRRVADQLRFDKRLKRKPPGSKKNYRLFDFKPSDNVEFVCMYGFDTTLEEDVERFRFLHPLPGAYVFVQEYQPVLDGIRPCTVNFFTENSDQLINQLIAITYRQNMKSMEKYYRWLSRRYVLHFGHLHKGLVDTIFRYNNRDKKGHYIATMAGTITMESVVAK